jgi:tetratricopeptide (TPR) repeat protein
MSSNDRFRLIADARRAIGERKFELAASIAAALLSKTPDDLEALEIKALVEIDRGDNGSAEVTLRSAIALAPKRRWPYGDLARLLLRLHRETEAEEVARAALTADTRNADAHAILGSLFTGRERWFEAATHFESAISLAGPHLQLLAGLGQSLLRLGRLEQARATLEAAAAADPDALEPAVYLAELEERLGRFGEAQRQLDRAESIARRQGTDVDLQRSVLLDRMGEHERALALLDSHAELSGAALLQRGRLRERAGRYAEAWRDWTTGKAQLAERSGRHYAADEVRAEAGRLVALFTSAEAAEFPRASLRNDVPQPIFIIGFPRSGTTLTEQILARHGTIRAGGELPFGAELHELAEASDGDRLRDLYLARAAGYGLLASGARYFTDKMPDNGFWLPLLRLAFPDSPVVLVRRHPLDVLTSVMAHDMTHGFNCGYRLEDAARHLALVDGLVETYRAAGLGPTFDLRYESLIADQAGETQRLMTAIGLEMQPAQLSFHTRAEVPTTPSYAQVREPLNDRSIGRWKHFAAELEPVRPLVVEAIARGAYAG